MCGVSRLSGPMKSTTIAYIMEPLGESAMARRRGKGSLVSLAIRLAGPGAGQGPLSRQLYVAMRAAILEGRLGAGDRGPASRVLATDLRVSRNTALAAVDQLVSEGYLE